MLIPRNASASDACATMRFIETDRPPVTPEYSAAQIVLPSILSFLLLASLVPIYLLRKDPTFYRIRPVPLMVGVAMGLIAFTFGTMLPEAGLTDVPCGFVLVIHMLSGTMVSSMLFARTLVFVVETRYHQMLLDHGLDSGESVSGKSEAVAVSWFQAIGTTYYLAFVPINQIPFASIVHLRQNYLPPILMSLVVPLVCMAIGLATIPEYNSGCVNCFIFAELVFLASFPQMLNILAMFRLVTLGSRMKQDDQGVLKEFKYVLVLAVPSVAIGYFVFHLFDPAGLAYRRVFNPQLCNAFIASFFLWAVMYAWPIYRAMQYRSGKKKAVARRSKVGTSTLGRADLEQFFFGNTETKERFYKFAAARYCMEHLNFLDEHRKYKLGCDSGQSSEAWMRSKALKLIKTFIRAGADQEINISAVHRDEITSHGDLELLNKEQLANLFTQVVSDVFDLLYTGVWLEFQNKKQMVSAVVAPTTPYATASAA